MPYGYVDPVQRVHQQQALRNIARAEYVQPTAQPVQSPLQLGTVPEVIYGNGQHRRRMSTAESMAVGAVIGAALGLLIGRNWHRPWVRGTVTGIGSFLVAWIVTAIGVCIVGAFVKPGDQSDLGPILLWTGAISLVVAAVAARAAVRRPARPSRS